MWISPILISDYFSKTCGMTFGMSTTLLTFLEMLLNGMAIPSSNFLMGNGCIGLAAIS